MRNHDQDVAPGTRHRLLLVEDDPVIALAEIEDLSKEGFAVHYSPNGEEAISALRGNGGPFSLVLMDIGLGDGMDGIEAAEIVAREFQIPVLFVTSRSEGEIRERIKTVPHKGVVNKGYGLYSLAAVIRRSL